MTEKLEFVADAPTTSAYSSVFFDAAFKFTISDDLHVFQTSVEFIIEQLPELGIKQMSPLESVSVDVTVENIIELLKQLLVSDTPLTDVFLGVHEKKNKLKVAHQTVHAKCDETEAPNTSTRNISLKLYVNKEDDTVLIAEANNDFADLLFEFLTYPMGALIGKLGGQSGIRCMDNLYNSVEPLKPANCYRDSELIGKLLNPKVPPFFKSNNQLIKLDEETKSQRYYCPYLNRHYSTKVGNKPCTCDQYWTERHTDFNLIDPKRGSNGDHRTTGGYMRISRYMVTDDLVITQPSSYMIITDILGKAAGKKIQVRNFEIGEHEALALLRASINSENVLTEALLGVEKGSRWFRTY